jgi:hypothetical protein
MENEVDIFKAPVIPEDVFVRFVTPPVEGGRSKLCLASRASGI